MTTRQILSIAVTVVGFIAATRVEGDAIPTFCDCARGCGTRIKNHQRKHSSPDSSILVHVFEGYNPLPRDPLDEVERIFALSDLHTDHVMNMSWLKERCCTARNLKKVTPRHNDALIVAGDISHELHTLEETLSIFKENLQCRVFFVFGNHEAWVDGRAMDTTYRGDSFTKLKSVESLCQRLGVYTQNAIVGAANQSPTWIVPIRSWYDGSLILPGCDDLCEGFTSWPWTDFRLCRWTEKFPQWGGKRGKIPRGLTEYFLSLNEETINEVREALAVHKIGDSMGLITYSHFLPNQRALPDWKDLQSDTFIRDEWLDHGAPDLSAKFALVAGSSLIERQLRSIRPDVMANDGKHIHVFGHSHRPKDFNHDGIRYIHNPLGSPRERESNMVPKDVDFKLIWDTRTENGMVPSEQILRYWEEKGGGLETVQSYLKARRKLRRDVLTGAKKL